MCHVRERGEVLLITAVGVVDGPSHGDAGGGTGDILAAPLVAMVHY